MTALFVLLYLLAGFATHRMLWLELGRPENRAIELTAILFWPLWALLALWDDLNARHRRGS